MNTTDDFSPWRVLQILDRFTVVIAGKRMDQLHVGTELEIVAVQGEIASLSLPLVVPKAQVQVSAHHKVYAIAKTVEEHREETVKTGALYSAIMGETQRTSYRTVRPALRVKDSQVTGNPGDLPVAVGDYVVKTDELGDLVEFLSKNRPEADE